MTIDLHIHTYPRSPCSSMDPVDLIEEARRIGLDGICLTEHGLLWNPQELQQLARRAGDLVILRGMEVTTDQGDVLVLGFHGRTKEVMPIQELRQQVRSAGGFMIAAHPFRGFLLFGLAEFQLSVEQASLRPLFRHVDALEVGNCKVTGPENEMARQVAHRLGLPGVAGSDAHRLEEVGRFVTVLERDVTNEERLIRELREGRFRVGSLR